MKVNSPNSRALSPEEIAHLEKLKSLVEKSMEDGKLSLFERERIKSLIWADGKVTYEELRILSETIKALIGDEIPDMDWEINC